MSWSASTSRPGWSPSPGQGAGRRGRRLPGASDVCRLPLADGSVDAVIVSKLFQHVPGWEGACRELLRVLRPGGAFIHLAERGAFGNPVRRYFAAMAEGMGFADRFPGMRRRADLVDLLAAAGTAAVPVALADLAWRKTVRYGDAWADLRQRLSPNSGTCPMPPTPRSWPIPPTGSRPSLARRRLRGRTRPLPERRHRPQGGLGPPSPARRPEVGARRRMPVLSGGAGRGRFERGRWRTQAAAPARALADATLDRLRDSARRSAPDDGEARLALARGLIAAGDAAAALPHLDRLVAGQPPHLTHWIPLAQA